MYSVLTPESPSNTLTDCRLVPSVPPICVAAAGTALLVVPTEGLLAVMLPVIAIGAWSLAITTGIELAEVFEPTVGAVLPIHLVSSVEITSAFVRALIAVGFTAAPP